MAKFAPDRDWTLSQLALGWLLHQPVMTAPIIGASTPEQVPENLKAIEVKLSADELAEIEGIVEKKGQEDGKA